MKRQVRPFIVENKGPRAIRRPSPTSLSDEYAQAPADDSFDDLPVRQIYQDNEPDPDYAAAMRAADQLFAKTSADENSETKSESSSEQPEVAPQTAQAETVFHAPVPVSSPEAPAPRRILQALEEPKDELTMRLEAADAADEKPKRGRPVEENTTQTAATVATSDQPKRGRGRPKGSTKKPSVQPDLPLFALPKPVVQAPALPAVQRTIPAEVVIAFARRQRSKPAFPPGQQWKARLGFYKWKKDKRAKG